MSVVNAMNTELLVEVRLYVNTTKLNVLLNLVCKFFTENLAN